MSKFKFINDGADPQAQAVRCYLAQHDGIENSWNDDHKDYDAWPRISRWENCREQGYVVWMRNKAGTQINIAWFEHRNSDGICAVKWEQDTLNAPTIDNAKFGDVYKDKYDFSHGVKYGKAAEMAEWIYNQLSAHWTRGKLSKS